MRFNYKSRGFVVVTLTAMLVVVGIVNYELSQKSLLGIKDEFKSYEKAQIDKNTTETSKNKSGDKANVQVVDSKTSKLGEKVTETSKEIEQQLTSKKNMQKASYVLDMKMTREKQRNELSQDLNEMINNPSTAEEARKEASQMKLKLVKDQETELKIENLLSAKGYQDALVYISDSNVNVVVSKGSLEKKEAAKVFELVAEQSNAKYENIKLMNNKQN